MLSDTRPVRLLLPLVAALLTVLVTGCGSDGDTAAEGPLPELRVGAVPGVALEVPISGLRERGRLDGAADEVSFTRLSNPDQIRTAIVGGELDVVTMPLTVAANFANRGADIAVLGVIDSHLLQLLGPAGPPISLPDLHGETVHFAFRGDAAETTFRRLLAERGLAPDRDVTLEFHRDLPELVAGLAAGRFRYAVLPEHLASVAATRASAAGNPTAALLDIQDEWRAAKGATLIQSVVIRRSLAESNPELVQALQRELTATTERVAADPGSAAAALAETLEAPQPAIASALPRLQLGYRPVSAARADVETQLEDVLAANPDSIAGRLPGDAFYLP